MFVDRKNNQRNNRIALFIPNLEIGGAERVIVTLVNDFCGKGYDVDLVLARKCGELLDELHGEVNIIALDSLREGRFGFVSAIITVIRLLQYVISRSPTSFMSTLSGANIVSIIVRKLSFRDYRLVVREASSLTNVKSRIRLKLMKALYPCADEVIVLTEIMKEELINILGLDAKKISVIGNPVDCERVQNLSNSHDNSSIFEDMCPYIVFIGRLVEAKGCFDAITAFSKIDARYRLKLVIIGEGVLRSELEAYVDSINLRERVLFLGNLRNPFGWLKNSRIFVLTSRWEGYPNTLLEAMCLRKPIVAMEYDKSLRCILSGYPQDSIRIVKVGDTNEFAKSIISLVTRPVTDGGNDPIGNINTISEMYLMSLEMRQRV
jgi:glycosyltransferase involved in cell wall biosynthesis